MTHPRERVMRYRKKKKVAKPVPHDSLGETGETYDGIECVRESH